MLQIFVDFFFFFFNYPLNIDKNTLPEVHSLATDLNLIFKIIFPFHDNEISFTC